MRLSISSTHIGEDKRVLLNDYMADGYYYTTSSLSYTTLY
jgi:hypothetical protein